MQGGTWEERRRGDAAPSNTQNIITKHTTSALVKAHKRTEVYATVLATVKKNVDVFQLVSCDNHLHVDTKRRSEAQELHSVPAAHQQ